MKEMVEQVLSEEERARELVRKAREQAGEKTRTAESEASKILEDARLEGQQIVKDALRKAREEAGREFQAAIEAVDAEASRLKQEKSSSIDETVQKVVAFLMTPAFEREE